MQSLNFFKFIQYLFLAARPKTLTASISPVILGVALSMRSLSGNKLLLTKSFWFTTLEILVCAILIQILCNYVNDLHDYYKGSDSPKRIGPLRVVQSGLISPKLMQRTIYILTSLIFVIGIDLSFKGGPIILMIGIFSIIGAYLYTAGPYPLAHNGLGEIFVLIFFGPIPVYGTFQLLTTQKIAAPALFGITLGLIASAILLVNNIRDMKEDSENDKKTIAVKYGKEFAIKLFTLLMTLPFVIITLLGYLYFNNLHYLSILLLYPLSIKLINQLNTCIDGDEFNKLLGKVGGFLFIFSVTLATLINI